METAGCFLRIMCALLWAVVFLATDADAFAAGASTDQPLEVTMTSTKKRPEAGSALDIFITVKNISDRDVYINTDSTSLVFPPQLSPDGFVGSSVSYWGPVNAWLLLRPKDETIFYGTTVPVTTDGRPQQVPQNMFVSVLQDIRHFWSFSPGDFQLAIHLMYALKPDLKTRHVYIKKTELPIAAPQTVILFGAALGGLFAYILFAKASPDHSELPWYLMVLKGVSEAISTVLVALVVTILLSRVTNTQFLLKVSIEDLWGAIAIGFAAGVLGKRSLRRLVGDHDQSSEASDEPEKLKTKEAIAS